LRVGGLCSNPSCARPTFGPLSSDSQKHQDLGVAAHINAASKNGPRYDASQDDSERHGINNGIWLCQHCAALIDKGDGGDFSAEKLKNWKAVSEKTALNRLHESSTSLKRRSVRTLVYINAPRLAHYADLNDEAPPPSDFLEGVPARGFIADKVASYSRSILDFDLQALDWIDTKKIIPDPTGLLIRFEGNFRTKNGPTSPYDRTERDLSDPYKSPHVYQKKSGFRLVLPYDPRFVTTSTASVELNNGTTRLGGFAQIKYLKDGDVIASPLYMGLTATEEGAALMDALLSR